MGTARKILLVLIWQYHRLQQYSCSYHPRSREESTFPILRVAHITEVFAALLFVLRARFSPTLARVFFQQRTMAQEQNCKESAKGNAKRSSRISGNGGKNVSHINVELANESHDNELERQYDLTPVTDTARDRTTSNHERRPNTPSYSIDPWEVVVSPNHACPSPLDSLDSGTRPWVIVDRTPADGDNWDSSCSPSSPITRRKKSDNNNGHGGSDEDDGGYDPDDEEEEEEDGLNDEMNSRDNDHADGNAKREHQGDRFLVPSDIHPNMEQREEDIAQLRLLAGKLNADWRGQDFMAPALARYVVLPPSIPL